MTAVKPRALAHRGSVAADGFFFDTTLLLEGEVRRRILALWTPGAVVHRTGNGYVLRLPQSRQVSVSAAPGTPLVLTDSLLLAAPLSPDEIAALGRPLGSVVLVRGGIAAVETLSPANTEDPATWLLVGDFAVVLVTSLGTPPPAPVLVAPPVPFDSRSKLKGVPPAVPELKEVLEALRTPKSGPVERIPRSTKPSLWDVLRPRSGDKGGVTGTVGQPAAPNALFESLRRFAANLALRADLVGMIGRKQALYVARMMDMFERGDMDAALRHAIPLDTSPGTGPAPIPALSVPTPRTDLKIDLQTGSGGSTLGFGPTVYGNLRTLYRNAFEKLEREGRIDEAAFVLADLLCVSEEAVAFLEKHQRLHLAAEMAEARNLPGGLVVRQWFLAGDTDRAVRIARRTGAFADAVVRLEKTKPEAAKTLRTLWAQSRARAGDYTGAVDTIWPVAEARHIAREWMNRARESGGVSGARMLARLLTLPEAASEDALRKEAQALLESEDGETAPERVAFTDVLIAGPPSPVTTALARLAVRSTWRDLATGARRVPPPDSKKLVQFAGDAGLRADLPPLPKPPPTPRLGESPIPLEIRIAANDTGTVPIHDAAFLPGGRTLVALGEAGVRLLARDGHMVAHFDAPAHRLVVSDTGNYALLLAPRGDSWTVSRLDLATRRTAFWTNAALSAFAPDYDGSLWFVASGDSFVAIDATAEKFEALWRMPNVPGVIRSIARSPSYVSFLTQEKRVTDTWGRPSEPSESWERWTYELPSLVLRLRNEAPFAPENPLATALPHPVVSPAGHALEFARSQHDLTSVTVYFRMYPIPENMSKQSAGNPAPDGPPILGMRSDTWAFLATKALTGVAGQLIPATDARPCVNFLLEGATRVSARLTESALTLADDRGRVLVLSLTDGTLLRNLRVS